MKKNLLRLFTIACFFVLAIGGATAQGINTPVPSPIVLSGNLIDKADVPLVIKLAYREREAERNVLSEGNPAWQVQQDRMDLLLSTHQGIRRSSDVEQGVIVAYTQFATERGRPVGNFASDPDFQYLVSVITD